MKISIELTDAQRAALIAAAARLNVSVDQLAAAAVRDLVTQPAEDFERAAEHVLTKKRAPYRRVP